MQIDLKTVAIEPKRKTFDHLQRRFGDKIPSRYQEATYDVQACENLHYLPTWDPEQALYDPGLSKVRMEDWYALKDPRQYYYSTYTLARARQQEAAESNFRHFENRGLAALLPDDLVQKTLRILIPLRHCQWGANQNNTFICGYGFGVALTQACMYHAIDNLGAAQYISRIGLLLGGRGALDTAKSEWMDDPKWQTLRRYIEDAMTVRDPVELFVVQNVCLDGLLYPLVFDTIIDGRLAAEGGASIGMLTQFITDWQTESAKWIDSVLKVLAKESPANKAILQDWIAEWSDRAISALLPIAEIALGSSADEVLQEQVEGLRTRLSKAGLELKGGQ